MHKDLYLYGLGEVPTVSKVGTISLYTDIEEGQKCIHAVERKVWQRINNKIVLLQDNSNQYANTYNNANVSLTIPYSISILLSTIAGLRYDRVVLVPGVNTIVFQVLGIPSPLPTANWQFLGTPLCYNARPAMATPDITNRTVNGFDVQVHPALAGTIEYCVIG